MTDTHYETVYVLRPDLTDEGMKKINDGVVEKVHRSEGKPDPVKDLGKRPLAYRIGKQTRGHYFQMNFRGPGGAVEELERYLRLSEDVIRFLTVKERRPRGGGAPS